MRLRSLLVVPLLIVLAAPTAAAGAAPVAPAADAPSWAEAGVPYVDTDAHVLRFGQGSLPVAGELTSVAASTAAAYVLDEHVLTIVPADGGPNVVVDRHVVGLPLADPVGHHGVWTTRTGGGLRLRAYDDRTAKVVRGPRAGGSRVFAVDGRVAFVTALETGRTRRWRIGHPVGSAVLPNVVSDAHAGIRVEVRQESGGVIVKGGKVRGRLGFAFGTLSPDARYVAVAERRAVYRLASRSWVKLPGLGAGDVVSTRWTPTGDLVVTTGDLYDHYDDANPLRRSLCDVHAGTCAALPGTARLADEPTYESSAGGVFFASYRFE